eukprot:s1160_g20.t1
MSSAMPGRVLVTLVTSIPQRRQVMAKTSSMHRSVCKQKAADLGIYYTPRLPPELLDPTSAASFESMRSLIGELEKPTEAHDIFSPPARVETEITSSSKQKPAGDRARCPLNVPNDQVLPITCEEISLAKEGETHGGRLQHETPEGKRSQLLRACWLNLLAAPRHQPLWLCYILAGVFNNQMATFASSKIVCDRYGVPQYAGEVEAFEEYVERAWDLYFGREGQDSQVATPIHLRSGLTGHAYEAVRKLEHAKLRTATAEGKATDAGMKLLIQTLKDNIAAETPVKINELFFTAFYSADVWRKQHESMQQYIIRREQDFARLKESSQDTTVSDNLRCMMLLTFCGLDHREQLGVLASVGNEYDFKKVSHALRIQFPQISGKPVYRRDYLGCGRGGGQQSTTKSAKWKVGQGRFRPHAFLADEQAADDEPDYDGEIYYDEDDAGEAEDDEAADEGYLAYSDDDGLDALISEVGGSLDDPQVAEAFATVAQFRAKKKGVGKKKPQSGGNSSSQSYPFKAHGDIQFDTKAKENRKHAIKFLKSMSTCTSCNQRGHWVGDQECPNYKPKGKGKGSKSKKVGSPKKASQAMFVLHDSLESADENEVRFASFGKLRPVHSNSEPNAAFVNDVAPGYDIPPKNAKTPTNDMVFDYAKASDSNTAPVNAKVPDSFAVHVNVKPLDSNECKVDGLQKTQCTATEKIDSAVPDRPKPADSSFTDRSFPAAECFMVLKETQHCEHLSYCGGEERQLHRGANGHTRHMTCKECNKTVICGRRREAVQLWSYLVQVTLCTKFGSKLRSSLIYRLCSNGLTKLLEDKDKQKRSALEGPNRSEGPLPDSPGWSVVSPSSSGRPGQSGYPDVPRLPVRKTATIVRSPETQCWLYGVLLAPGVDLPPFPELKPEDLDVLQPLPGDETIMTEGPFRGQKFVDIATNFESEYYCKQVMNIAIGLEPMSPGIFRLASYLYVRVQTAWQAGHRLSGTGQTIPPGKRPFSPEDMLTSRTIKVPLQMDYYDPCSLKVTECEVMMVDDDLNLEAYAVQDEDPAGLAILDSGCNRTMHGQEWAKAFEEKLNELGLQPSTRHKTQLFKGIGGHAESKVVKAYPVGLGGVNGELHSAETPGKTPMLVSRPFMQTLGTIINIGDGTVSFSKLGVHDLPLKRTSRGHLAVSLLDFDLNNMSVFDELVEGYDEHEVNAADAEANGLVAPGLEPASETNGLLAPGLEPVSPASSISPKPPPSDACSFDDGLDPDTRRERQDAWDVVFGIDEDVVEQDTRRWREGEGFHCESTDVFLEEVEKGFFSVRKPSSRKAKKIDAMDTALCGLDALVSNQLKMQQTLKAARKPPTGKTWLKQVFAGQMGLTILAVFHGMLFGVPRDISLDGWDALTPAGKRQLHHDFQQEDPFCTVLTQPCGPWGNWSRFNISKGGSASVTVLQLREDGRPLLKLVNKTIKDRLRANRHVFMEQPLGSQVLDEPEMSDVRQMVEDGTLLFIVVDGCMVGYKDAVTGLPHKKPSFYITSMLCAESVFATCRCDQSHQHQPLEGNNEYGSRTQQAAAWPSELNQMVLDCIIQQAAIEEHLADEVYAGDSQRRPASGPSGRFPKRRKQGRMSTISSPAPPVYVRPQGADAPQAVGDLGDLPPDDDASFRAQQAAVLDPILNQTEADRRHNWLQVDPEIRKLLRTLHVNFGHPTSTTMQRILRRQGAKPEVIRAAGLMACDACGESIRQKRPKPVRLPSTYQFNQHILADTFYAKNSQGKSLAFLNIVCDATGFQVVSCLGELTGTPSSGIVLRHFLTSWSSWAGLPHSLQVDRGKEYMAQFSDYLKQYGVEQQVIPLESPWQNGKCERAGGLWKEVWAKTVIDVDVSTLADAITAASIVTQTRNAFPRPNGYSPNQWVLGHPETRLPGSLLDSDESQQLEVLEAAENPHSEMARTLAIREAARVAQIRLDSDSRVRRALLRQSTPTRGPYPIGSYVYFYRRQPQQRQQDGRPYNWYGPARVIGLELRNPRRTEDGDPATDGSAPHSYWLRYGPSVILASGEQLRFASEDELLAAHYVPHYAVEKGSDRGARNYVDIRNQLQQPLHQLSGGGVNAIYEAEMGDHVMCDTITDNWRRDLGRELVARWVGETHFKPISTAPASAQSSSSAPVPSTVQPRMPQPLPAIPEGQENPMPETVQEQRTGDQPDPPQLPGAFGRQVTVLEPEPVPTPTGSVPQAPMPSPGPGQQSTPPFIAQLHQAMLRPQQLDGHPGGTFGPPRQQQSGYGPQSGGARVFTGPYFGDAVQENDWPHGCEDLSDRLALRRLTDASEFSDGSLSDDSTGYAENPKLEAFLTGKAVRSEINLNDLSAEDRAKFDQSMEKEWNSFKKFSAVEVLTESQIAELPQDAEIVNTRWVHTDKNQKPRLMAGAMRRRTGKSEAQIKKEYPFEAKSRMVVIGCQEKDTGIRSDSPTASLLAFNLVTCLSVIFQWILEAFDASTAYLQSHGIARLLLLRPPRPPPPGVSPFDLLRAKGSIYGTRDAGRSWWKKLFHALFGQGWIMSKLEAALFFLFDGGVLVGALAAHVDDLYATGTGEKYEKSMKFLEKEIYLKRKVGDFRFCGKNVKQNPDGSVSLDQIDAIESLEYMVLQKDRRAMPNAPLTEDEKSAFRGLIGSLGWIARQTRPDVLVNVSLASQTMGNPTVKDVVELNKVVKVLKDSYDFKWNFVPSSDLTLENAVVFCMADSSFANTTKLRSQCGYIIGLTTQNFASGEPAPVMILETYSGSIKRVCRSTLAAETNGFLTATEAADYLRMLLLEIKHPGTSISDLDKFYYKGLLIALTDAKSLESTLNKDAGQPTDKRVKILISQVKEFLGGDQYEDDGANRCHWCDTSQMLADVLTKSGCEREPLLEAMSSGKWQLRPSAEAEEIKQRIRDGRRRRKEQKKKPASGIQHCRHSAHAFALDPDFDYDNTELSGKVAESRLGEMMFGSLPRSGEGARITPQADVE